MKFSPNNFLQLVKQIVCGGGAATSGSTLKSPDGGFNQDFAVSLGDAALGTGTTLTTDAAGLRALSNAASSTNLTFGTFGFLVPRDYDQANDNLIVRVIAAMNGATDTPALTVASSTQSVTVTNAISGATYGSTYGALTAGSTVASGNLSSTMSLYEFNLSGMGLKRDTLVSLKLTVGSHATNTAVVYGVELVYSSCLVAWGDAYDKDALAIPLRG